MSLLKKLHGKLYQKKSDIENREFEKDTYNPTEELKDTREDSLSNIRHELFLPEQENEKLKEFQSRNGKLNKFIKENKKSLLVGMGVFAFVFLVIVGILAFAKYKESLFNPEKVVVTVEGSDSLESGVATKYKIKIKNDNKVGLLNAVLKLNFSKELTPKDNPNLSAIQFGSARVDMGTIGPAAEKNYDFEFDVFGAKDTQGHVEAVFSYNPENFSSSFESRGQVGFSIKSSALELTVLPTREAASGELVEVQTIIENKGNSVFDNIALSFDYPMGFNFSESQPEPNEKNNYWLVGSIEPGQQKKITISGNLIGETESMKNFSATLGQIQAQGNLLVLTKDERLVKITSARLQLTNIFGNGDVPETVSAGDTMTVILKFKNTSNESLRNLVLFENISSPVIDKASFNVKGGFYDSAKEQIIWKASQIPQLSVLDINEEGQIEFTFKIKKIFPMKNETDKNFVLNIQPEIESLDIDTPLGQNKKVAGDKLVIKVASKLVLDVMGAYNDGEIANSGPYPPKTGEKSTYTLRLSLKNTSNDLKEAVMHIDLPAGISWENKFLPDDQKVEFDSRTNELVWKLGTIPAGTGFLSPIRSLAFQVGLTPSENQMDPSPSANELIAGIKVTAIDAFTEKTIDYPFGGFKIGQLSDY